MDKNPNHDPLTVFYNIVNFLIILLGCVTIIALIWFFIVHVF